MSNHDDLRQHARRVLGLESAEGHSLQFAAQRLADAHLASIAHLEGHTIQPYEQLEMEYGKWAGVENCVCCSSGTAALHLAFEALDLPKGSVILMSDFNMIACARAAVMAGLEPDFVDCDDRLLIDVEKLEKQIRYYGTWIDGKCTHNRVSAILATHIYGRGCDMKRIREIADKYRLRVVEDCAEYHGGTLFEEEFYGDDGFGPVSKGEPEKSDAYCWSFYKNKIVAGEEGGMISFPNNSSLSEKAKSLRSLGFTPEHDFMHIPRGHNYRMSNLHARPILDSLAEADHNLHKRMKVETWYNEFIPEKWHMPARDVVWVYDLRIPDLGLGRMTTVVKGLNERGIAARHSFRPMSEQPEFSDSLNPGMNAYRYSRSVFYLPVSPAMSRDHVSTVASMTISALRDVGIA